jgi:hypothetical protein
MKIQIRKKSANYEILTFESLKKQWVKKYLFCWQHFINFDWKIRFELKKYAIIDALILEQYLAFDQQINKSYIKSNDLHKKLRFTLESIHGYNFMKEFHKNSKLWAKVNWLIDWVILLKS